jgi:cation:H+ antiporter
VTVAVGACLVGLVLLVQAADQFVLGAARLARRLGFSPIVVGAVVIGFGPSAPELLVSSLAATEGDRALGVGNVIGSNVANLGLVLGLAAVLAPLVMTADVLRREAPLALVATVAFALVAVDGHLGRPESLLLVLLLVVILAVVVVKGRQTGADEDELARSVSPHREGVRAVLGLVGTVLGAQLLVSGATDIADRAGLSGGFVGFSLVALGTSMPEIVTTLAAARRGETGLILGNLLGSNVFNALAVGGAIGIIGPGEIGDDTLTGVGLGAMVLVTVLAFGFASTSRLLTRVEGAVLFAVYVAVTIVLATSSAPEDEPASPAPAASPSVAAPTLQPWGS